MICWADRHCQEQPFARHFTNLIMMVTGKSYLFAGVEVDMAVALNNVRAHTYTRI